MFNVRVDPKSLDSGDSRENSRLAPTAQVPTLILSFDSALTSSQMGGLMRVGLLFRNSVLAAGLLLYVGGCAEKLSSVKATVRSTIEVEQLIASQVGKVVVVHLWALW